MLLRKIFNGAAGNCQFYKGIPKNKDGGGAACFSLDMCRSQQIMENRHSDRLVLCQQRNQLAHSQFTLAKRRLIYYDSI